MINYPKFVKTKKRTYKINTDYRFALRCDEISKKYISEEEKALAIIYILFGEEGLNNAEDWNELLEVGLKYLSYKGTLDSINEEEECDMSFEQDWGYIQASFFGDYGIDLSNCQMHWYQFFDLLNGLSEESILGRIRYIRNFDLNKIKDSKERETWIKQKERVALKTETLKTTEQKRLDELFEKQLRGG